MKKFTKAYYGNIQKVQNQGMNLKQFLLFHLKVVIEIVKQKKSYGITITLHMNLTLICLIWKSSYQEQKLLLLVNLVIKLLSILKKKNFKFKNIINDELA